MIKSFTSFCFVIFLSFLIRTESKAQGVSFGPLATINYSTIDVNTAFSLPSNGETVSFLTREARPGFSFGGFLKLAGERFYVQPELLFTQSNTDLTIQESANPTVISNLRYNMMEVPVKVGWQPSRVLRLFTGLIYYEVLSGSLPISINNAQNAELTGPGAGRLSYMFGAGFDLGRVVLGVRYDSSFRRFNDGIVIDGQSVTFGTRPNVWRVAIAYKLFTTEGLVRTTRVRRR
jgi:hypothetical protein